MNRFTFIGHRTWNALACLAVAAGVHGYSASANAGSFPEKPITIIVHSSPGGQLDATTRPIASAMSEILGQPIVIENKPGASGMLGIHHARRMPADGYTLLAAASTFSVLPALRKDPGYTVDDFSGIGMMVRVPYFMVASTDKPYNTAEEFISVAKSRPNGLSFGSAGNGTTAHLSFSMFMQQEQLELLHIPYKGNAAAVPDLVAGRTDVMFDAYGVIGTNVQAGRLKILGVTSSQRLPKFPEIPTLAEQTGTNFTYDLWLGLLAPKGTPDDVIKKLSAALHQAQQDKRIIDRAYNDGTLLVATNPEEFDQIINKDLEDAQQVVERLGLEKD